MSQSANVNDLSLLNDPSASAQNRFAACGRLLNQFFNNGSPLTGSGQPGRDGVNGRDGQDGKPGLNGKDGRDGKDGRPGLDGKDGKDGQDGKDGGIPGLRKLTFREFETMLVNWSDIGRFGNYLNQKEQAIRDPNVNLTHTGGLNIVRLLLGLFINIGLLENGDNIIRVVRSGNDLTEPNVSNQIKRLEWSDCPNVGLSGNRGQMNFEAWSRALQNHGDNFANGHHCADLTYYILEMANLVIDRANGL